MGAGLQDGVDSAASLALHRQLRSKGDAASLGLLQAILSNTLWSDHRVAVTLDGEEAPACIHCGLPATEAHEVWLCSRWAGSDDPAIAASAHLSPTVQDLTNEAGFWLRGWLPRFYTRVVTPFRELVLARLVGGIALKWGSGTYYTDGSGGPQGSEPLLRRCGVACCQLRSDADVFSWGVFFAMPGEQQSVPRAELAAVVAVLALANEGALHFVSDSLITVNKAQWLLDMPAGFVVRGANADLWADFLRHARRRALRPTFLWIKSHITAQQVVEYSAAARDIIGNEMADALAERAGFEARCCPDDLHRHRWASSTIQLVQRRLMAVRRLQLLGSTPADRKAAKAAKGRVPAPSRALAAWSIASQHEVVSASAAPAGIWCSRCKQVPEQGLARAWLRTKCVPRPDFARICAASAAQPSSLFGMCLVIGAREVHGSHSMHLFKGIFFCSKCGYYSGKKLQHLREACIGTLTKAGAASLSRLRSGKLPSGIVQWPPKHVQGRRSILL